jgi:hypothetical protein
MEKRNKFLSGMLAIALMFSFALMGCPTDSDDDGDSSGGGDTKLVGTWNGSHATLVLNADGSYTLSSDKGTWTTDGTKLKFQSEQYGALECTYKLNAEGTLSISNGTGIAGMLTGDYTKQP